MSLSLSSQAMITSSYATAYASPVESTSSIRTTTTSAMNTLATTTHSGGLAQCEGTNFGDLDLSGLRGTICRISLADVDISSCCSGQVRSADTCTQYCQVSSQVGNLTMSESTFAACVEGKQGERVGSECGIYYGPSMGATASGTGSSYPKSPSTSSPSSTPTAPANSTEPYTGAGTVLENGIFGRLMSLACLALLL